MSYLRQFDADKIKIDRSFVQSLGNDDEQEALAITKALVSLGNAMDLTVAVEGAETEDQEVFSLQRAARNAGLPVFTGFVSGADLCHAFEP